jgi:hypothetical protein
MPVCRFLDLSIRKRLSCGNGSVHSRHATIVLPAWIGCRVRLLTLREVNAMTFAAAVGQWHRSRHQLQEDSDTLECDKTEGKKTESL